MLRLPLSRQTVKEREGRGAFRGFPADGNDKACFFALLVHAVGHFVRAAKPVIVLDCAIFALSRAFDAVRGSIADAAIDIETMEGLLMKALSLEYAHVQSSR